MKYVLIFLTLFFVCKVNAQDKYGENVSDDVAFSNFKTEFTRSYRDATKEALRKGIFLKNRKLINDQNKIQIAAQKSLLLKVNNFADYSDEEFDSQFKGLLKTRPARNVTEIPPVTGTLPTSLDYRAQNAVSGAQFQGRCGSSYSFAAIATLEAQLILKKGTLVKLSEQQAVDCWNSTVTPGNSGCAGGLVQYAFKNFHDLGGVATLASYPYTSGTSQMKATCKFAAAQKSKAIVSSFVEAPAGEDKLHMALVSVGPIAVGIDTKSPAFRFYSSGVYSDTTCGNTIDKLDHAVVVIGYNTNSKKEDYWIIKNSWGSSWGTAGFGKMARNKDNSCGIATDPVYPVIQNL